MTSHRDAMWAYFAILCILALGIGVGVIYTRAYYDGHCPTTVQQSP